MNQIKKSCLIRLNEEAINSMSTMLMELLNDDKSLKVNHSKLASLILTEFHTKYFDRAKPRFTLTFQDKKKCIMDKIEGMDFNELEATIKYLEKIKKMDFSNENIDSNKEKWYDLFSNTRWKERVIKQVPESKFFDNFLRENEWLTTEQASYVLSISPNALRIMVHRGQIQAYKFGRRLRFKRHDCLALIKMKGA